MIQSKNILNNEQDFDKHKSFFFTEKGYDALLNYCHELHKLTFTQKKYPFKMPIVLGIPMFEYSSIFESKEQVIERIKSFMQLLGIIELRTKINDSEMSLSFKKVIDDVKSR